MNHKELNVSTLACDNKQKAIFDTIDALSVGQSIMLVNDHDPKPMRNLINTKFPDQFTWEYSLKTQEVIKIIITRIKEGESHV